MIQRRAWLRRKTPLRSVNPARRARLNRAAFGPQARLCRKLPCCVCNKRPPSDPAHVVSRGAGGRDLGNIVPLCRRHHNEQGARGIKTFQSEHAIDLAAIARELAEKVRHG